jgi:cytidylate kinase
VGNLQNKIIALTGLSGSGKSTIAAKTAEQNGSHVIPASGFTAQISEINRMPDLMRFLVRNYPGKIISHRPVLDETKSKLPATPIILDGVYSRRLLHSLIAEFGRENVVVVHVVASFSDRRKRILSRGQTLALMLVRDAAKMLSGAGIVNRQADTRIVTNGQPDAIYDATMQLARLIRPCLSSQEP